MKDICYFTDDSKTKPREEYSARADSLASIFQGEVTSTETFPRLIEKDRLAKKAIPIYSDSQASLKGFESNRCISKTVWSCRVGDRNRVSLVWVPGYTGQERNQQADKYAIHLASSVLGLKISSAKNVTIFWVKEKRLQHFRSLLGLGYSKCLFPAIEITSENFS